MKEVKIYKRNPTQTQSSWPHALRACLQNPGYADTQEARHPKHSMDRTSHEPRHHFTGLEEDGSRDEDHTVPALEELITRDRPRELQTKAEGRGGETPIFWKGLGASFIKKVAFVRTFKRIESRSRVEETRPSKHSTSLDTHKILDTTHRSFQRHMKLTLIIMDKVTEVIKNSSQVQSWQPGLHQKQVLILVLLGTTSVNWGI